MFRLKKSSSGVSKNHKNNYNIVINIFILLHITQSTQNKSLS